MKTFLPIADIPSYDPENINKYYYTVVYKGDYKFEDYKEGDGSHPGVDIDASKYENGQTPIYAVMDGTIIRSRQDSTGWGYHIIIQHDNAIDPDDSSKTCTLYSCYAHLSELLFEEAEFVTAGQQIGLSGSTGNSTGAHLHFQIDRDSAPFHPYWPFTKSERESAGYDFWGAVNAGFNKKNVDLHCINPLIYLQQYLDAERYSDTEDSPYTEAIEAMSERGIFQGYEDGSFRPENPINRAEALKILFEASNTPLETNYSNYLFTDTDSSQWYYPYVASSQIQGYVQGYSDGSFHPAGNITRAEFLKIVLKFFNIDENSYDYDSTSKYGDISYSAWYYPYIMRSEGLGLTDFETGSNFSPDQAITRGEAAWILSNITNQ